MSDKGALGSIQQSLRRCFDTIEQHHEEWKLTLLECDPLITNLSNLAEQLEACQKVIFENSPLSVFTDLPGRLNYKLKSAMGVTLEKLNDKMCILQRVRDSVSHQVGAVLYVYEVNAEKVGLEAFLMRSTVSPSIADMLEWLQDIEKHYRNQYLQRRLLLQVHYDNLSEIRNLPQNWSQVVEKSAFKQKLVEDTLLNVSFFRETS